MPQLSYQIETTVAIEGSLADTTFSKDTVSRVSLTALPCARLMFQDTTASLDGKGVKLPDSDFTAAIVSAVSALTWADVSSGSPPMIRYTAWSR